MVWDFTFRLHPQMRASSCFRFDSSGCVAGHPNGLTYRWGLRALGSRNREDRGLKEEETASKWLELTCSVPKSLVSMLSSGLEVRRGWAQGGAGAVPSGSSDPTRRLGLGHRQ